MANNSSYSTEVSSAADAASIVLTISFYWQVIVSCPAVALNFAVLMTYMRNPSLLPPSARVVLTNQSFLEMCCSAFALILIFTKDIKPNIPGGVFGDIICNIWDDFYWCAICAVELNCVIVTVDRFLAVCFPMKRLFTRRVALTTVVLSDLFAFSIVIVDVAMMARYDEAAGICIAITVSRTFQIVWGVLQLLLRGLLSLIAVVVLYPPMIHTIIKSGKQIKGTGNADKIRDAATSRLLRTCLIAAVALIVSQVPNIIFFYIDTLILGKPHSYDSPEAVLEVMFTSLYTLLSPIIYSFSTQKFREALIDAFSCSKKS